MTQSKRMRRAPDARQIKAVTIAKQKKFKKKKDRVFLLIPSPLNKSSAPAMTSRRNPERMRERSSGALIGYSRVRRERGAIWIRCARNSFRLHEKHGALFK